MSAIELIVVLACAVAGFFIVSRLLERVGQGTKNNNQLKFPSLETPTDGQPATALPAVRSNSNYFVRHWRGELSLPVSYWLNGLLANVAVAVAVFAINSVNFREEYNPAIGLLSLTAIWSVLCIVTTWQVVGVWRSATKYKTAHPNKHWGGIAKCFIAIAVMRTVFDFNQAGAPQIAELYRIYDGDLAVGGHAFRVLQGGRLLEFSGGITFGTANEFHKFLNAMSLVQVVKLSSPGGRVSEAQRIGNLIQSRGLNTFVGDRCASACTIIFLHGRERIIGSDAQLGFHQPDFPGLSTAERSALVQDEDNRLRRLGVAEAFIRRANSTPPNSMWFPSSDELRNANVATRIVRSVEALP